MYSPNNNKFLIPMGRLFDTIVDRFFDTPFISMHSLIIGPTVDLTCGLWNKIVLLPNEKYCCNASRKHGPKQDSKHMLCYIDMPNLDLSMICHTNITSMEFGMRYLEICFLLVQVAPHFTQFQSTDDCHVKSSLWVPWQLAFHKLAKSGFPCLSLIHYNMPPTKYIFPKLEMLTLVEGKL